MHCATNWRQRNERHCSTVPALTELTVYGRHKTSKQVTIIQCDKYYDTGRYTEGAIKTKRQASKEVSLEITLRLSVQGYAIIGLVSLN